MPNSTSLLPPTNKRRSFRASSFRPLTSTPTLESLNDSLRASLMSVGMRVRKSVPEGYKTHAKPKFAIYEQTAAAYPELQPFGSAKQSTGARCSEHSNEDFAGDVLTDAQLEDAVDSVLDGLDEDLFGWRGESSSQESCLSVPGSVVFPGSRGGRDSGRRKRSLRDGDEGDDGAGLGSVPMERDAPLRAIAQPRSRRPGAKRIPSDKSEKTVRFANTEPLDDFGEADFLMPDRGWDA